MQRTTVNWDWIMWSRTEIPVGTHPADGDWIYRSVLTVCGECRQNSLARTKGAPLPWATG